MCFEQNPGILDVYSAPCGLLAAFVSVLVRGSQPLNIFDPEALNKVSSWVNGVIGRGPSARKKASQERARDGFGGNGKVFFHVCLSRSNNPRVGEESTRVVCSVSV